MRLYLIVMPGHLCPSGLKSKVLLKPRGYEIKDHWLTTRDAMDTFEAEHDVATTPRSFVGDVRIGGYGALRRHFGKRASTECETNVPLGFVSLSEDVMMVAIGIWMLV